MMMTTMKQVTRLINKKSKKASKKKDTQAQYDPFVSSSNSGTINPSCSSKQNKKKSSSIVAIHNYGKLGASTNPNGGGSSSGGGGGGRIQYSSLKQMRGDSNCSSQIHKKPKRFSKWQRYFKCCTWCWLKKKQHRRSQRQRDYRNYWKQPSSSKGAASAAAAKNAQQQRRRFRLTRLWSCCRKQSSYQYDSEEDDDIDAKFEAYLMEMKQRHDEETKAGTPGTVEENAASSKISTLPEQTETTLSIVDLEKTDEEKPSSEQPRYLSNASSLSSTLSYFPQRRLSARSQLRLNRRAWTWDDSLRSNSDRFLETLEEDLPQVTSLAFVQHNHRPPLHVAFDRSTENEKHEGEGEEAKAAAEELNRSPVMGAAGRHDANASSPNHSRGSGTSETWPAQSDEDIDRLVAMHQNRSSMSSLGVRSESMASVYSGAGEGRYGTVVVKGQVEFAMQYNYKLGALEIHIVRCKDLAAVDAKRNRSDPYVKVYLLPDKSKAGKRKTKVKKHTLNPIFDETMRFQTPISSLESRTLWLTVWHSDMFGRNDFLGEVTVNLQGRVFDNPHSQWYLLQERSEPFDEVATYRGDIVVGLKFVPAESVRSSAFSRGSTTTGSSSNLRKFGGSIKSVTSKSDRSARGGQLHVLVKEAKHLSPIKANGTCDAFCKSYLLPDRSRNSKQKTPVVKRSLNPSWNYTFIYEDVSLEDLYERALELTVWDHDRLASNEFVGGIRFSLGTGKSYGRQVDWMDATGKELSLWQNMMDRPNFWVEGSLVLRSTLDGIRAMT